MLATSFMSFNFHHKQTHFFHHSLRDSSSTSEIIYYIDIHLPEKQIIVQIYECLPKKILN